MGPEARHLDRGRPEHDGRRRLRSENDGDRRRPNGRAGYHPEPDQADVYGCETGRETHLKSRIGKRLRLIGLMSQVECVTARLRDIALCGRLLPRQRRLATLPCNEVVEFGHAAPHEPGPFPAG
jgi:hypothetical protein